MTELELELIQSVNEAFKRIKELENSFTELQVFLNGIGILPSVHYFDNDNEWNRLPKQESEE